jgi:DNA-binding transcriptional MocR family regulator
MNRILTPDRLATLVGVFDRKPAYRGLRRALQELIGDGRIALGTRLPSERAVAQRLDLARNTVTRAYADLISAGFATARQGAGTFAAVPDARKRAHSHTLLAAGKATHGESSIDLNCAASGATPGVAAAYERALAALPAHLSRDGYLPAGLPALQARIAQSYAQRGVPTAPEQIIVTSGALAAIAVVARALSRPGDRLLIETPVYSNAIEALRLGGARLVSAPLDDPLGEDGWDLDGIEASLRQTAPHLAYLIPDFQNPSGFLMPEAVRARYAAVLRATRTVAIVDEAPFAAFAADAITLGSASKLYWGGLRVGWIRAPQTCIDRLIAARVQLDLGSSLFDQLVVAELLDTPSVAELRRAQLRQRRDVLVEAIGKRLPGWRMRVPQGGLSLWLQLPHGSATQLAAQAEAFGVHLAPGPVFSVEGGLDQWLRIPYAKPEEQLLQAVERIAAAAPAAPVEYARRGSAGRGRTTQPLIA